MENQERAANITVGGEEYQLLLTTRATKEIAGRYGGLENLGTKLMKSENFEMALDEIIWLIVLLANQSILVYNLRHREEPRPLLTAEEVELLTSPMNLHISRPALIEAFQRQGKDITKATPQEMRSLVCAQCHVEYFFKGDGKYLTFPWDTFFYVVCYVGNVYAYFPQSVL